MKIPVFILAVSSLFLIACKAQKSGIENTPGTPKKEETLSNPTEMDTIDFFEIDKFENLYWVNRNKLYLQDIRNQRKYLYENDRLGNITSIDVSNPQKILVFYDDYDYIITLDNTLFERSQIDLKVYEYVDINAVGLSNDNNLWLYDPTTFQLKKIDEKGNSLAQSLSMYRYYLDHIEPIKIVEKENLVYVLVEDGILLFDNLGQYMKLLPFSGLKDFQIIGGNIIYVQDHQIVSFSLQKLENSTIENLGHDLDSQLIQIRIGKESQYLRYKNKLKKQKR